MNLRDRILEHVPTGGIQSARLWQLLGNEDAQTAQIALASMLRDSTLVQVVPGYYERRQRALKHKAVKPPQRRPRRVPAVCPICEAHVRVESRGQWCANCKEDFHRTLAALEKRKHKNRGTL